MLIQMLRYLLTHTLPLILIRMKQLYKLQNSFPSLFLIPQIPPLQYNTFGFFCEMGLQKLEEFLD